MPPRIREIIARLGREGWLVDRIGKHIMFEHPDHPGLSIAVPNHPPQEIAKGTLREISRKAGWD